jgi:hypothetical protein
VNEVGPLGSQYCQDLLAAIQHPTLEEAGKELTVVLIIFWVGVGGVYLPAVEHGLLHLVTDRVFSIFHNAGANGEYTAW